MSFALGFDYGLTRIGVATGQKLTKTASPLTSIKASNGIPDWKIVENIIQDWLPSVVVIGLPLHADGSMSEMAERAKKFGQRIHGRFGVRVDYINEFETTWEAKQLLERKRMENKHNGVLDATAASLILERWLGQYVD